MTVRVSRTFEFDVPGERIWEFIADPEKRAGAISVVDSYDLRGENRAVWHVKLPIPLINSTVQVQNRRRTPRATHPRQVLRAIESAQRDRRTHHHRDR